MVYRTSCLPAAVGQVHMEEEGCSQLFAFKHRSKLHHSEPQFLAYIEIVDYSDAICAGRSFCRIRVSDWADEQFGNRSA
jgi:hypothetical protein